MGQGWVLENGARLFNGLELWSFGALELWSFGLWNVFESFRFAALWLLEQKRFVEKILTRISDVEVWRFWVN